MPGLLEWAKVLDLTHYIAGPDHRWPEVATIMEREEWAQNRLAHESFEPIGHHQIHILERSFARARRSTLANTERQSPALTISRLARGGREMPNSKALTP